MDVYKSVSRQIHEIFHDYTDIIEPLSLDEAFLDVTDNKQGISLAVDIAKEIKKRIWENLNLIASAGVSYNKFLAKIASDYRKPNGLCTIHPSQALDFIARLPIESFWGVGPVTCLLYTSVFCLKTLQRYDKYAKEKHVRVSFKTCTTFYENTYVFFGR